MLRCSLVLLGACGSLCEVAAQEPAYAPPLFPRVAGVAAGFDDGAASDDSGRASATLDESSGINASTELEDLRLRLEELEAAEEKRSLAEKVAREAQEKDEAKAKIVDVFARYDEKWTVKLGGHVQLEYINWADASPEIVGAFDYFEFRRLRLAADGTGYGVYDFRFQMTLEPEAVGTNPPGFTVSPDVKDAYFSINEIPWIGRLRVGNFFVPFSLEQVTNDTNNIFLERSIPTQGVFAVDREVGIALYNHTENERITWASGVFFDSISEGLKERIDDNQGYRVSGRVTFLPYYEDEGRFVIHTGLGVLYTADQDNRVRFRSRPQIHEGPFLIDSGNLDADATTTGNLEGAIVCGPLCIQSEYFLSQVSLNSTSGTTVQGGYVHVSYLLTGEHRNYEKFGQHGAQFGRFTPDKTVYLTRDGASLGAWELRARYSNLNLQNVSRGEYNDLTLGVNWYWSDRVRIMFDYIHPVTTSGTPFGATTSNILGIRFDWNW